MNEYIWATISFFSVPLDRRFLRGLNIVSTDELRVLQKDEHSASKWRMATKHEISGEPAPTSSFEDLRRKVARIEANQADVTKLDSVKNLLASRDSMIAEAMQNADEALQTVERITSQKVPVGIITGDYALTADQQRSLFQFDEPGVVTLATAKNYYERRTVLANAGNAIGLIEQTFIRITRDGANVIVNPVIRPGESLEFLGVFMVGDGNESAPDDLEINGEPADDGSKGFYALMIINFDFMGVTWEEFEARTGDGADLVLYFENKLE